MSDVGRCLSGLLPQHHELRVDQSERVNHDLKKQGGREGGRGASESACVSSSSSSNSNSRRIEETGRGYADPTPSRDFFLSPRSHSHISNMLAPPLGPHGRNLRRDYRNFACIDEVHLPSDDDTRTKYTPPPTPTTDGSSQGHIQTGGAPVPPLDYVCRNKPSITGRVVHAHPTKDDAPSP